MPLDDNVNEWQQLTKTTEQRRVRGIINSLISQLLPSDAGVLKVPDMT